MSLHELPDLNGYFGAYGGRFIPESLMPILLEIEQTYNELSKDPNFHKELADLHKHYTGRPSPLYYARSLSEKLKGPKIYLKRDELNHTGAHKINNCLGQALVAKKMGRTRIIAETGAGQHGVATATICAKLGLKAVIYMGAKDAERQKPNVFRMKLLGAEVIPVSSGTGTLKAAMNEALRDWVNNISDTYYLIGTAAGPHPFPKMVRDFQSVIGTEAREQILKQEGKLPKAVFAAIGGGSNAIGLFSGFMQDEVRLIGAEAAGKGIDTKEHAASLTKGEVGILHGNKSYYLQDDDGQILDTYSISAGLDYPGIGPEHAYLKDIKRAEYYPITDKEALEAFKTLARSEGIIPALEPSHALALLKNLAAEFAKEDAVILNLCGRGDKDIFQVMQILEEGRDE